MDSTQSNPVGGAASPFRRPPRATAVPAARPSPAFGPVPAAPLTAPAPVPTTARPAPPRASAVDDKRERLLRHRRSGALWFYWVAGLSLVNSLAALTGQHWRFILGLGITQLADALAAHSGRGLGAVAVMDAVIVGGFVLLGRFAERGRVWAFGVGAAIYALDGLIFVGLRDWIGVAFHVFVLVMTVRGLDAARRLA
ncbi:MAG TPA: hypothetical protein VGA90_07570 [Methylomirabilota bacterium]